ncbi:MAG: RloB family protein [Pseudohongiellaceae bacterium]
MARRKPKGAQQLQRRQPLREPYDRVLIVCEGTVTEPAYFRGMKEHYGLSTANIAITPASGQDPSTVVRHARRLADDERKLGEKFDRVYCVFDRDEHANFEGASEQIRASGFCSARSWPCFEYWLLLHYEYRRNPFLAGGDKTAAQHCTTALVRKMPAYTKGAQGVFQKLQGRLDDALNRAERARRDAEATGSDNPSTEVHSLVEYLRNIKRRGN